MTAPAAEGLAADPPAQPPPDARSRSRLRPPGWAIAVFAVALVMRLGFLLLYDQPLLYSHQYSYFDNALRLAQHPDPLRYILFSEQWRTWDEHWTIAPLYFLFVAAVFKVFGTHLLPLQIVQCVLESLVAVLAAHLGRRFAGPRGAWAGIAYAVCWSAVELPSCTLTENVHTLLLVAGTLLVAHEPSPRDARRLVVSGVVLGLSALTRSVSSAFLVLAGLWHWRSSGGRAGIRRALLVWAGGALVIAPWTARNVFLIGDPVPIETTVYENILWANHLGSAEEYREKLRYIDALGTPREKREAALRFGLEGIRAHPERFVRKVWANFRHLLRPEGLDGMLRVERSVEPFGYFKTTLGDDMPLLLGLPLVVVWIATGRASPARSLVLLWSAYYLAMIVIVFHNEVRYRSAVVPFAFAAAAGGAAALADPQRRRAWRTRLALAVGLGLSAASVQPYVAPAWRALRASRAMHAAQGALERGDVPAARAAVEEAARQAPASARPWQTFGRDLARRGLWTEAAEAYREAQSRATSDNVTPALALPRVLAEAGRPAQARIALRAADEISWRQDPWFALEIAWAELPPPRTDEIVVGDGDYGAVRGFFHPRGIDGRIARRGRWNRYDVGPQPPPGPHRWTRARSWLRVVPMSGAPAYEVTLWMGSPFPSPRESVAVTVKVGGERQAFKVGREIEPFTLRAAAPGAGEPLLVQLDSPTWIRLGEPAEQGVRVDRLSVRPAS